MDSDMTDHEDDPDRCPCCTKGGVDPATNYHWPGSPVCSNCDGTGFVGETLEDLRKAARQETAGPEQRAPAKSDMPWWEFCNGMGDP